MASSARRREEFERARTGGSDLSWALRSLLWGYDEVRRHVSQRMQLGPNDVSALEHLLERPDLGPADLAALLGISTASATALVDRLEGAGHVERRPHPDDRRRKQLAVTDHATTAMSATLRPLFDLLTAIDDHYTDDERRVIGSYLRRVGDAYRRYTGADRPA